MSNKYQVNNPIFEKTQQNKKYQYQNQISQQKQKNKKYQNQISQQTQKNKKIQYQNPILQKNKSSDKLYQQIYRDIKNNVFPKIENPKIKTMFTQIMNFFEMQNNYFENVTIIDKSTNLEIQNEILKELFFLSDNGKSLIVRMNDLTIFSENLFQQDEKLVNNRSQSWKQCKDTCATTLNEFIQREFNSTVFMIRLICNSLVSPISNNDKTEKVFLLCHKNENEYFEGNWEHDKQFFTIENTYQGQSRLILGFGPSASGKTYWTKTIISLLKEKVIDFPQVFLSIDGGLIRELSIVYQMILHQIQLSNFSGFVNLVNVSPISLLKNLFDSEISKKKLIKFLKMKQNRQKISIYVPLTLGGCFHGINCQKSYQKYIDLTNDKSWIGLMIWQHKLPEECNFISGFKCKSTTLSGKQRQIYQGKKYSSGAYNNSMRNGNGELLRSNYIRLEIHNSGGLKDNKSIIMEHPIKGKYRMLYDNDDIIFKDNFIIIPKSKEKEYITIIKKYNS